MKLSNLLPARFRPDIAILPVVRLHGAILAGGSPFRQNLNLAAVAAPLERAFALKRAPAVLLSINSPGGSAAQSRLIFGRIRELAKKHEKKTIAFVEDAAASGGYMIALAADEIVADETSIVGSIGVIAAMFGFDKAIEKLGVDRRVYTAGENKLLLDPFQPEKERDVRHLRELQDDIHRIFIDMVRERRGDKLKSSEELFSGLFWTGAKARELGLIDACGHMDAIVAERFGDKAQLRLVGPRRHFFGRAQPGVTGAPGGWPASLAGGVVDAAIDVLQERALWNRLGL
jgi:signal peptide peptidase SppA